MYFVSVFEKVHFSFQLNLKGVSAGPSVLTVTSVAIAQIVALIEASDTVFKLSAL